MDKETARRVHLARWRRFVLAFLVIAMVSAAVGLYTSPLLRVQKLQVVGATAVSADEVELAGPPRRRQHDAARLRLR